MNKIWEFKVEYKRNGEVSPRFHYFSTETYEQAEEYHENSIKGDRATGVPYTLVSVLRKCPYQDKWIEKENDDFLKNLKK